VPDPDLLAAWVRALFRPCYKNGPLVSSSFGLLGCAQFRFVTYSRDETNEAIMGRPALRERPMTAAERQQRHRDKQRREAALDVDPFAMTNLYPRRTGLPMTIWVSPRGHARHAVRIKVNMAHGARMTVSNTAVVRLKPKPQVISGRLSSDDQAAVFRWILLNEQVLLDHWNGAIDGGDLIERLRPLPPQD